MRALWVIGLVVLAGPALAEPPPPAPTSAWLERQQAAAADEANAAGAAPSKKPETRQTCREVKQWKVGDTVVKHRICEDAPKPASPARQG